MKQKSRFKRLFEPITIGTMECRNRISMLPMENNYAAEDGSVTERLKDYYAARAKDVGLVIVQITCVEAPRGKSYRCQLCIDDDRYIPGLRELAGTIQEAGARAVIQLHHGGPLVNRPDCVAASALPAIPGLVPHELSLSEINDLIDTYVSAARRAKKAGFDGIEIVASGGYLVWSFLSPAWNRRRDQYGGDLKGRARFFMEIIGAIRDDLGTDYPATCRIAIREYDTPEGLTVEESCRISQMAEAAGLDGITMTAMGRPNFPSSPGALLPLAQAVKEAVSIPVNATGRMDLELGERALAEQKGDLIGIARRLVADADFVGKSAFGREEEIIPCIACLQCLHTSLMLHEPMRCTVNPACGREKEAGLTPAKKPKRVLVVGGGPGGVETAVTAAKRGHAVTLCEKEEELGGQLIVAAIPPDKEHLQPYTAYLQRELMRCRVAVKLGREMDAEMVKAENPEAVVVATGLKPLMPQIAGLEMAHVVTAADVLSGKAEVGMEVVVIGGDQTGCETAEYLVERDRRVTILELQDEAASKLTPFLRPSFLERLERKGVLLYTGVKQEEFKNNRLVIVTREGEEKTIEVNTVVIAAGGKPNDGLYHALKDRVPELYRVGDCAEPRDIMEATTEGLNCGMTL